MNIFELIIIICASCNAVVAWYYDYIDKSENSIVVIKYLLWSILFLMCFLLGDIAVIEHILGGG